MSQFSPDKGQEQKPAGGKVEPGPITPYDIWFAESYDRLTNVLCDDAHLEAAAERAAVARSYREAFAGRKLRYSEIIAAANAYGRQLTDQQREEMHRRLSANRAKRDEIAERIRHDSWHILRRRALKQRETMLEMAGLRWIAYPPHDDQRKPTDEAGMEQRQRDAEEFAKQL